MMTVLRQKYTLVVLAAAAVVCFLTAHIPFRLPLLGICGLFSLLSMVSVIADQERIARRLPESEENHHRPRTTRPRVLIVGAGAVGQALAKQLEVEGRYCFVGFADDQITRLPDPGWQILGSRAETAALVCEYEIDEVFLAYAPTWQQAVAEELMANHADVRVRIVPSPFETLMRLNPIENLGDIALAPIAPRAGQMRQTVKRMGDMITALGGLVVFAPLMLISALLIKLTSRGPVIFAQERVGYLGKAFILYKFRTMVPDAEASTGPTLSTGRQDSRLTPVGRWLRLFRIDELPQLWNVLRGDMSLVGPRPERPHFVQKYQRQTPAYALRHQVRPGITGLAQVCGDYHTDPRDKLRFDLIYSSHQSLWLDISILLRTVLVIIFPSRR